LSYLALTQAGFIEGADFDYYGGRGLSGTGELSVALASSYETIVTYETLSDSTDVQFLTDWRAQAGDRRILWMARNVAERLYNESSGTGLNFLNNVLGVDYLAPAVRDFLGGQASTEVVPMAPCFTTSFTAGAGCPVLTDYNYVAPVNGSELSHEFLDRAGNPYMPPIAAGIIWPREELGYDKSTAFFPLDLNLIWDLREPDVLNTAARAQLLREAFACMGINGGLAVSTGSPPLRFAVQQNVPNPFNPSTRISYTVAHREQVQLIVYDVAGRKVRTLVDEVKTPGPHFVDWDSRDDGGNLVSSGIYHYRLRAGDFEETKRMVLIK